LQYIIFINKTIYVAGGFIGLARFVYYLFLFAVLLTGKKIGQLMDCPINTIKIDFYLLKTSVSSIRRK
jgi:hypothetical protein